MNPSRSRWLALLALLAAAALAAHGPIAQPLDYHHFSDTRAWGGLPNAANVLSNLPFALIGAWGWLRLTNEGSGLAWRALALCVGCTAWVFHLPLEPQQREPGRRPPAHRLGLRMPALPRLPG